MDTTELIVVIVGVLLALVITFAGFAAMIYLQARFRPVAKPPSVVPEKGSSVVVHTLDARSIRGYVLKWDGMHLQLDGVEYLSGGHPQRVGGIARIPMANVGWVQDLTKPEDEVTE